MLLLSVFLMSLVSAGDRAQAEPGVSLLTNVKRREGVFNERRSSEETERAKAKEIKQHSRRGASVDYNKYQDILFVAATR